MSRTHTPPSSQSCSQSSPLPPPGTITLRECNTFVTSVLAATTAPTLLPILSHMLTKSFSHHAMTTFDLSKTDLSLGKFIKSHRKLWKHDDSVVIAFDGLIDYIMEQCGKPQDVDQDAIKGSDMFDSKMGQLRLAPSRGDGVRVFYESLYKENSKAPMAAKYMLDHGLLNDADAKKVRAYLQTEVKKEKKRKTEEKEVKAKKEKKIEKEIRKEEKEKKAKTVDFA